MGKITNVKCCGTCVSCEIGNNEYEGIYCNKNNKSEVNLYQMPCEKYEEFDHPNAYIKDILFY